jgi:hypothetical protein
MLLQLVCIPSDPAEEDHQEEEVTLGEAAVVTLGEAAAAEGISEEEEGTFAALREVCMNYCIHDVCKVRFCLI